MGRTEQNIMIRMKKLKQNVIRDFLRDVKLIINQHTLCGYACFILKDLTSKQIKSNQIKSSLLLSVHIKWQHEAYVQNEIKQ